MDTPNLRLSTGLSSEMTPEQAELAKENYGLYFWFLGKHPLLNASTFLTEIYEDKILDGFLRGCKGFNPSFGFLPATYLTRCMYNAKSHFFSSLLFCRESADKIGGNDIEELINSISAIDDMSNETEDRENNRKAVDDILSTVKDSKTRKMIEMRFGLNGHKETTYKDIGKEFNLSKQRVEQIVKEFLRQYNPDF